MYCSWHPERDSSYIRSSEKHVKLLSLVKRYPFYRESSDPCIKLLQTPQLDFYIFFLLIVSLLLCSGLFQEIFQRFRLLCAFYDRVCWEDWNHPVVFFFSRRKFWRWVLKDSLLSGGFFEIYFRTCGCKCFFNLGCHALWVVGLVENICQLVKMGSSLNSCSHVALMFALETIAQILLNGSWKGYFHCGVTGVVWGEW